MGKLVDGVTGDPIDIGAPVYAILGDAGLDPESGDAADAGAGFDRFAPLTLPLRGTVDAAGGFVPRGSSRLGVEIVCSGMGAKAWSEISGDVLRPGSAVETRSPEGGGGVVAVNAVLAFMTEQTWEKFCGPKDRARIAEDVEDVKAVLADILERTAISGRDEYSWSRIQILNLNLRGEYRTLAGREIALPPLAAALGRRSGPPWLQEVTGPSGRLGFGFLGNRRMPAWTGELLTGIAELQHVDAGMRALGLAMRPPHALPEAVEAADPEPGAAMPA